jgi:hypothetical protein
MASGLMLGSGQKFRFMLGGGGILKSAGSSSLSFGWQTAEKRQKQ